MAPLAVALLLAVLAAGAGSCFASSFVPKDDTVVLEQLPVAIADAELERMRQALRTDPDRLDLATELARRWLDLARAEGDPRYEGYAAAALEPWMHEAEPPLPVMLLRASLASRRHDFSAARVDLEAVLKRLPDHPQALLSLALVQVVQGEPAAAGRSCSALPGPPESLLHAACAGAIARVGPEPAAAYRRLETALERESDAPPALRQWAATVLGELARHAGNPAAAERQYRAALAAGADDVYLLAAYADFLLDNNRPGEVRDLIPLDTRAAPLVLRLAIADTRLGVPSREARVAWLRAAFETERRRGDAIHLRERSRFALDVLDDPAAALEDARTNWTTQREPADALLVMRAAAALNDPDVAREVLDWMRQTGIADVRLEALASELEGTR